MASTIRRSTKSPYQLAHYSGEFQCAFASEVYLNLGDHQSESEASRTLLAYATAALADGVVIVNSKQYSVNNRVGPACTEGYRYRARCRYGYGYGLR